MTQNLISTIIIAATAYYEDGSSPLSDSEFDSLIDELRSIDPDHPLLNQTGWGYKILDGVEHPYHEITGIAEKYKALVDVPPDYAKHGCWKVMPKLDGSSVILYYKNGILQNCVTRGDGVQGRDVTKNLIDSVPETLSKIKLTGYIRCEVVVSKTNFTNHFPEGKSQRNVATGLMGAKTPDANLLRYLDVIPVTIYDHEHLNGRFIEVGEQFWHDTISDFKVKIKIITVCKDHKLILTRETLEDLANDYLCDGLVIRYSWKVTDKMFAYKFDDEVKNTIVTKVEWVTHGTGKLFPTIHYEPTEISGCTATKASGKSRQFIIDNGIGVGAEVRLVRSGEVIPNILDVIKPVTPEPVRCQYGCDPELLEIAGAHIYCRDPKCPALAKAIFERLINTFAPKTFSDSMREAVMKAFDYNVFKMLDFYKKNNDISLINLAIGGLTLHGRDLVCQMLSKMTEWHLRLHQLADIVVIEYFGDSQSKKIEEMATTHKELTEWAIRSSIIDPDLVINVRAGQNWALRHSLVQKLLAYFSLRKPTVREVAESKGFVCITGKIESGTKKNFAAEHITPYGYTWVETLTDATILIDAEGKESSKIRTAKRKGIKIIPIKTWIETIKEDVK